MKYPEEGESWAQQPFDALLGMAHLQLFARVMTTKQEVVACFTITGSFDPLEITRRLGVEPTESWRKGDPRPRHPEVKRESSRWSLFSRLAQGEPPENHFRDIIAQMDCNPDAFRSVSREFGGHIQLVRFSNSDNQRFELDRPAAEDVARYALTVGLDFYFVVPNEPPEESHVEMPGRH